MNTCRITRVSPEAYGWRLRTEWAWKVGLRAGDVSPFHRARRHSQRPGQMLSNSKPSVLLLYIAVLSSEANHTRVVKGVEVIRVDESTVEVLERSQEHVQLEWREDIRQVMDRAAGRDMCKLDFTTRSQSSNDVVIS